MAKTATAAALRAESALVEIAKLKLHPRNPRQGDVGAIVESIKAHGVYKPIVVQRSTMHVLAGNHTLIAQRQLGLTHVPAYIIDVDDATALRILLTDNRVAELAAYDDTNLATLLKELALTPSGLVGTGYDGDDLDAMLRSLASESAERPVMFKNEALIEAAFKHYRARGLPPRPALSVHECMQEINKLVQTDDASLRSSTIGYDVADTYHSQRFSVRIPGKRSVDEVFKRDDYLRHALGLLLEDGGTISDAGLLSTLGFVRNAQVASNFRPGYSLSVYRRFADSGAVLDTSAGFGGRLVGFIASRCKLYVGIDPSPAQIDGNIKLARDLGADERVRLFTAPVEDVELGDFGKTRFDVAFTSPPYFMKELYDEGTPEEKHQSWKRYPIAEAWRDKFLTPMIRLQYAALKRGGHALLNVNDVKVARVTVPIIDWTTIIAKEAGFELVRQERYPLSRIPGRGVRPEGHEPVLVLRKP